MKPRKQSLSDRVIALIEGARQKVAYTANLAQVYTNYEIGRQIVEKNRAASAVPVMARRSSRNCRRS